RERTNASASAFRRAEVRPQPALGQLARVSPPPRGPSVADGFRADDANRVVLSSFDLGEAESQLIARALEVTDGNRTRAAELLGLSVRTLRNKLNTPSRT